MVIVVHGILFSHIITILNTNTNTINQNDDV